MASGSIKLKYVEVLLNRISQKVGHYDLSRSFVSINVKQWSDICNDNACGFRTLKLMKVYVNSEMIARCCDL